MIESKVGQRIGGTILFILGAGATAWTWHSALTEGEYYPKVAMLGPAFAVVAIGMIVFPMDMEQLRLEHGVPKPDKLRFAHFPLIWKAITVVAVIAGVVDWIAIEWL
jgi:hypothetical protein